MKKKSAIIFLFFCLLLVSCAIEPSEVTDDYAKKFVEKVKYVQDEKTGLCFAVVATRKAMSANQNGISWTWVPCDQVEKFLINKKK